MIGSHVIPRYYLEQFAVKRKPTAESGRLWVYSTTSPPRQGTAKNEGVENGYFGLPTPAGGMDESLEQRLAVLENEANDVLIMAANETFVWSSLHKRVMASYAGLLYARSKARRDATAWVATTASRDMLRLAEDDEFIQEMVEHYRELTKQPIEASDVRDPMKRAANEIATPEGKRMFFLNEILGTAKLISEILLQRPWQVWKSSDANEFITSDSPIVTMLPIDGEFAPGFGFNSPGVLVAFPLNSTSSLIIGRDGTGLRRVDPTIVAKTNYIQILCMFQNVYCRTESQTVETAVKQHGGYTKFGENAFLIPGDLLPMAKQVLRQRMERQRQRD